MLLTPEQSRFNSTHQTHHTSVQALDAQTNKQRKGLQDAILNILLLARERGVTDMTVVEIAYALEASGNGARVYPSSLTSPVSRMLSAKLVERLEDSRPCLKTGHPAAPIALVNMQVSK